MENSQFAEIRFITHFLMIFDSNNLRKEFEKISSDLALGKHIENCEVRLESRPREGTSDLVCTFSPSPCALLLRKRLKLLKE